MNWKVYVLLWLSSSLLVHAAQTQPQLPEQKETTLKAKGRIVSVMGPSFVLSRTDGKENEKETFYFDFTDGVVAQDSDSSTVIFPDGRQMTAKIGNEVTVQYRIENDVNVVASLKNLGPSPATKRSPAGNRALCDSADPEVSIAGCTTLIQAGKETPENLAQIFYNRGNAYLRKSQYDAAIKDYDKAIGLNPAYAEAFVNRGSALYNSAQNDLAIQNYDQAIKLNPGLAQAFYMRGIIYLRQEAYDRAIGNFDQAIAINPEYADAFANRAMAYHAKGQYERTIQDFSQVIKISPNSARAFFLRGLAKKESGDLAGGDADVARAKELDPQVDHH